MPRSCAVVIALWLCAACGNPAPPRSLTGGAPAPAAAPAPDAALPDAPPPLDRDYPRLAGRAVTLYEAIAEALRAGGEDCALAAAGLGALATAYGDVIAANAKILHEGRARELRPALAAHGDRFDAAAKAIIQSRAMAACHRDPAFTKAYDELLAVP
jgi:hypothetical protein